MRKTLLFCLLSHYWLCQAQNQLQLSRPFDRHLPFSRKDWLVGFQVGYSKNSYVYERYSAIQAYGGYFVADKLLVGLAASRGQESFRAVEDVAVSVGPMIRYQFTRTRLSPFIVGSYQFGQATVSNLVSKSGSPIIPTTAVSQDRPIQSRYVGAGTSFRLVGDCRLDLLFTWQDKPAAPESGVEGRYNLLQVQIGANYSLTRRH